VGDAFFHSESDSGNINKNVSKIGRLKKHDVPVMRECSMVKRGPEILLTDGENSTDGEVRYHINICGTSFDVFFRSVHVPLYPGVEPALPLALLGAMRNGSDLRVLSSVSKTYVRNVRKVTTIFSDWFDQFSRVSIHTEEPVTSSPVFTGRVGAFFSGGVDSFYTFLRRADEITDLIYIHGFDVRLDDLPRRHSISEMGRAVAEATGTRFIEIESNLGKIIQEYGAWADHGHGMALASVGRILQGYLDRIYIPSGPSFQNLRPWGSHPATDPLFGDEALTFVHHGCEATRVEKLESISDNELAMRFLRVCWERVEGKYNCGECEKCLRTMVTLYALGTLEKCAAFDSGIDIEKLRNLTVWNPVPLKLLDQNLWLLEERGLRESPVFKALENVKRRPRWLAKKLHKYRKRRKRIVDALQRFSSGWAD
jgi:hypothetical protein